MNFKRSVTSIRDLAAALGGLLALTAPASAGGLTLPFDLQSASVLPAGVRNPQFKTLWSSIDSEYDGSGKLEPLGAKLNQNVTWNKILEVQPTNEKRGGIKSLLDTAGITDLNGSAGRTTGEVNSAVTAFVPVFALGVTSRLTLGVAVPILHYSLSAGTGFVGNASTQNFLNTSSKSTSPMTAADAAAQLNNAVNEELKFYGYEPISSRNLTGVGDVKLCAKYLLDEGAAHRLTVRPELTLPTGTKPDPNQLVDVSTGSGQYSTGATLVYARDRVLGDLGFNLYGGYLHRFADRAEQRIPTSADDFLTADRETVRRVPGGQVLTGAALTYEFPRTGVNLGAGYHFQYLGKTSFDGSAFGRERYDFLENQNPLQRLHSATISAGFSSIGFYKQGRFAYPLEATLNYSVPLSGTNVTSNSAFATEVVVYF